jgi:hypothetical protein
VVTNSAVTLISSTMLVRSKAKHHHSAGPERDWLLESGSGG